jgi:hypothetical protein
VKKFVQNIVHWRKPLVLLIHKNLQYIIGRLHKDVICCTWAMWQVYRCLVKTGRERSFIGLMVVLALSRYVSVWVWKVSFVQSLELANGFLADALTTRFYRKTPMAWLGVLIMHCSRFQEVHYIKNILSLLIYSWLYVQCIIPRSNP